MLCPPPHRIAAIDGYTVKQKRRRLLKNSPRSRDHSAAGALPGGTASATVDTPYYGDIMAPPIAPVDVVSLVDINTDRTIRTALRFCLLDRDERHGLLGLMVPEEDGLLHGQHGQHADGGQDAVHEQIFYCGLQVKPAQIVVSVALDD